MIAITIFSVPTGAFHEQLFHQQQPPAGHRHLGSIRFRVEDFRVDVTCGNLDQHLSISIHSLFVLMHFVVCGCTIVILQGDIGTYVELIGSLFSSASTFTFPPSKRIKPPGATTAESIAIRLDALEKAPRHEPPSFAGTRPGVEATSHTSSMSRDVSYYKDIFASLNFFLLRRPANFKDDSSPQRPNPVRRCLNRSYK